MTSIANLRRPAFLSGSITINENPETKPLNNAIFRRFQQNDMVRPSFKQTAPRARHGISEDRLRMIDIREHGTKVQLSEKALTKLSVMVKDATDKKWLEEKARRIALGETIEELINKPPLGRPQRQKEERVNIGSNLLPLNDNIVLIESAIANDDYADKPNDLIKIIYKIINNDYARKKTVSQKNWNRLKIITTKLNAVLNIDDKQIGLEKFMENPAKLLLHLLTQNDNIYAVLHDNEDNRQIPLTEILELLKKGRIIDLENKEVLEIGRRIDSDDETKTSTQDVIL